MESPFVQMLESPAIQPFLPFFFTLAIVYGLLSVVGDKDDNLFGKESVKLLISLVFAFFAAGYSPFVEFFFGYFSFILWGFVALFFVAFFLKVVRSGLSKDDKESHKEKMMIMSIVLIVAVTVGFRYLGHVGMEIPVLGTHNLLVLMGLFLILFIIYGAFKVGNSE